VIHNPFSTKQMHMNLQIIYLIN